MNGNRHGSHSTRRSTLRRSFKPEVDLLEQRNLLSGLFGHLPHFPFGSLHGVPIRQIVGGLHLVPPHIFHGAPTNPGDPGSEAGLVFSTNYLQLTRGGAAATYTVALATQPTADVTVTISQDNPELPPLSFPRVNPKGSISATPPQGTNGPLTITPTTLTFTVANWNKPQTVTVSVPADAAGPPDQLDWLVSSITSTDTNYNNIETPPVAVAVLDNNPVSDAGVIVSKDNLEVTSGGSGDSFTVALATKPTANVTITISQQSDFIVPILGANDVQPPPGGSQDLLDVTPVTLTFTPDNWNTAQTVKVAVHNGASVFDGQTVCLVQTATSNDPNYNDLCIPPVSVLIHGSTPASDAGVVVSKERLEVTQGGTGDSYTVALASQPAADVTITITQIPAPELIMPDGPNAQPPSNGPAQGPLDVTPTTLTFTHDNWNTAQTVKVSAPASTAADLEHGFVLLEQTVTSTDPNYNNLFAPPVGVVVEDSIPAGSLVLSKDHLDVTEGGTGDTYTIALASQPTADVTVTIGQFDPRMELGGPGVLPIVQDSLLTIAPTTLTFTKDNWNQPQTVTVTAPTDSSTHFDLPDGFALLHHKVTSNDPNYNDLETPPVKVAIHDDTPPVSQAGVVLSTNHLELTADNHHTDSFTVTLASKPTSAVTITITESHIELPPLPELHPVSANTPPRQGGGPVVLTIAPTTLTFTPDNWNQAQTVKVSAGDSSTGLPGAFPLLTFALSSADANYNNLFVPPVGVAVPPEILPPIDVPPTGLISPTGIVQVPPIVPSSLHSARPGSQGTSGSNQGGHHTGINHNGGNANGGATLVTGQHRRHKKRHHH